MGKPEDYVDYPHSTLLRTGGYQPFDKPEWPPVQHIVETDGFAFVVSVAILVTGAAFWGIVVWALL